jgi:adenylate cyclase
VITSAGGDPGAALDRGLAPLAWVVEPVVVRAARVACHDARVVLSFKASSIQGACPAMASTRRLAAILAAAVAGYSRLMGADEEGTHERLKAHLSELVEPKIREHHGRIVKTTGDGVLAEFASVVDAVRCAVEIQQAMADRDLDLPEQQRLRFRIGVNLGDVIVEPHDIFGDGVNIAARLEGLAEPGGICISRVVRDQIRNKLPYQFEDLGEQNVKNIARPVRVFALRPEGLAARPKASESAASNSPPVTAPRLSILVLPFTNLSNDPEQQYLADGITEDVTTDLSRIPHMFVISRNTAFAYQGKRVDTKQIGRELGVRYILEGSVRRSSSQVRVNAQLIDAETDAHLWADRFDSDTGDLFALQDEVTSRIASALNLELTATEAARPTAHPDALDYILRGRAAYSRAASRDKYAQVISLYERALELDPQSAEAQGLLARTLAARATGGWTDTAAADLVRAEELASRALAVSWRSPLAHYAKAHVLSAQGRPDEAIPEYETAIALNRNFVFAYVALGACNLLTGSIEDAIPLAEQAIRLGPRDPNIFSSYLQIGLVHLLQSHTDEAIVWFEKARNNTPSHPRIRALLASAYALNGDTERAAPELAEARRLIADDRYASITRLKATRYWGVPRFSPCSKPPTSPGCARPGCRRNDCQPVAEIKGFHQDA